MEPFSIEAEVVAHAYVIIVPNPIESETCGIRRGTDADRLGKYYFWMKIGDSSSPKQRLSQYKDPDRAFVVLNLTTTNGHENPGKALEKTWLDKNPQGGLKPGAKTEWRALCARTHDDALELRHQLINLLEEIPERNHTYDQASDLIGVAVKGTNTGYWNARGLGKSYSWVSIVVQPRIDKEQANWGFSILDEYDNLAVCEFRVSVKSSITKWDTVDGLIGSQYANLCPDISYNAIQLPDDWSRDQGEQAALSIVSRIGKVFKCPVPNIIVPNWDSGWFTIQVPYADLNKRDVLIQLLEQFHLLSLTINDTKLKSSKPTFI